MKKYYRGVRRNCLLRHVVEGKTEERIEATGRGGRRRRKQLLDNLKEETGYWKLEEEALEGLLWRIRFAEAADLS
jgi:hypothetical protein